MLETTNLFGDSHGEVYYLMNKDEILIKFRVVKNPVENVEELKVYKKPFWINNLYIFLKGRKAPSHRKHIADLLEQCGCNTLKGYLDFTHALSLNDTIWVKKESEKDLDWSKVSLYSNEFDETIARIAFSGGVGEIAFSSITPELGTDGQFPKCWIREDNDIYLLKKGNSGMEPYSEYYGSNAISLLCDNVVNYNLVEYRNSLSTKCRLFTSEKYGYVPASGLSCEKTVPGIFEYFTELGFDNKLKNMFVGDSVIMNEDRHLGNFGVLVDNETFEIVDFAPIFDHNISMLCYADRFDLENIDAYLKYRGHKLEDGNFIDFGKAFLTPENKKMLNNIYGYEIEKHKELNLEDWRLAILSKQVNNQIRGLLS